MRVVLDTNILISALINPHGVPSALIVAWREQRFALVTSIEQLVELGDVSRRPVLRAWVIPARVGRFIHDLRRFAEVLRRLPQLERSTDPADNLLLAMAQVSKADYLVSGDRRGLLALKSHGVTRIVPARELLKVLGIPQLPRSSRPKRKSRPSKFKRRVPPAVARSSPGSGR